MVSIDVYRLVRQPWWQGREGVSFVHTCANYSALNALSFKIDRCPTRQEDIYELQTSHKVISMAMGLSLGHEVALTSKGCGVSWPSASPSDAEFGPQHSLSRREASRKTCVYSYSAEHLAQKHYSLEHWYRSKNVCEQHKTQVCKCIKLTCSRFFSTLATTVP